MRASCSFWTSFFHGLVQASRLWARRGTAYLPSVRLQAGFTQKRWCDVVSSISSEVLPDASRSLSAN